MYGFINVDKLIQYANNSRVGIDANDIARFPRADVVERKHGEWIQHVNEPSLWSCSICETVIYSEHEEDRLKFHKWCGCCGADMRGDTDEQIH